MLVAQRINLALRPVPPLAVYLAGAVPAVVLVGQALTGALGVDPVKELEHALGLHALQFLVLALAVTPLRRLTGVNLVRWRRALGLLGFGYVLAHLAVWLALDIQFRWSEIWVDILKRPYVTVGMLGFALLVPLAVTSTDRAIRKMGPVAWRRLHRLAYLATLAGAAHYMMLVKAWPLQPIVYLAVVLALLFARVAAVAGRAT
jgi:sulfoxide reductase heme-binding subunit YedZ